MFLLRAATARLTTVRPFSSTSSQQQSLMFALSTLSNRQETQHFAQQSKLSRVHHSPALEMIRESEVKPFAKQESAEELDVVVEAAKKEDTTPPSILDYTTATASAPILEPTTSSPQSLDAAVLQTLQQMSLQLATLEAKLVEMGIETEKDVRRTGAVATILLAGVVTGLGVWKFWPPESVKDEFKDRHFVRGRSRVVPKEVVENNLNHAGVGLGAVMGEPAVFPVREAPPMHVSVSSLLNEERGGSWWKNVFWKKS